MNNFLGYFIAGVTILTPLVVFIVFLILAVIHIRKCKKGEEGKAKAITFSIITGVALMYILAEVLMVFVLSQGVAHM